MIEILPYYVGFKIENIFLKLIQNFFKWKMLESRSGISNNSMFIVHHFTQKTYCKYAGKVIFFKILIN